jgi:hypothetical protein
MNKITFLALTTLLVSSLTALHIAAAEATAKQPNVIVILTDDQGYGDLTCHGNPILKTPQIDRLHAESVRFSNLATAHRHARL